MIRPLQDGDYSGLVRVLRILRADSIYTPAGMRHLIESMPERAQNAAWVADEGGIVGWGWAHRRCAHRRRGLATLAKLATIRLARDHGIETIVTDNAEENAAMLAINERLGYRPLVERRRWKKELGTR